ncbi:MAG TPA: energy transducer TonB [Thermoanaerobaculia bacterium]|jgi:TonB family protein|nr:energy transducer TonB [Thermoanaerobaculia bacterium]
MLPAFLATTLLATTLAGAVENPRFVSPNGEMCVVIRWWPRLGDSEQVALDDFSRRHDAEPPVDSERKRPRAALYRLWPGDYRELLAELDLGGEKMPEQVLVADDGHFVIYDPLISCAAEAELLTIAAADGSVVRTLRVRDVITRNDHDWLCRGPATDIHYALDGGAVRATMLVADPAPDAPVARDHTVTIELATGAAAAPDRDHCPAALRIEPEADDALPRVRVEQDVVPLTSQTLLDRAVVRVLPEYPTVAWKARISGRVGVQVVVGVDGKVEWAEIVKPLPFGLDHAVRERSRSGSSRRMSRACQACSRFGPRSSARAELGGRPAASGLRERRSRSPPPEISIEVQCVQRRAQVGA